MKYKEALQEFGLPATPQSRAAIRRLLEEETEKERAGKGQPEILRTLCVQLFSIGQVEDSLLIWSAKMSSFDAGCGLDLAFLFGAGVETTKQFLAASPAPEAKKALEYMDDWGGDFSDWTPEKTLAFHRRYYHLDPPERAFGPPKAMPKPGATAKPSAKMTPGLKAKPGGRKRLTFWDFLKLMWRAR